MRDWTRMKKVIGTGILVGGLAVSTVIPAMAKADYADPFGVVALTPSTNVKSVPYTLAAGTYCITPKFNASTVETAGNYYTGFYTKTGNGTYNLNTSTKAYVHKYVTMRTYTFKLNGKTDHKVFLTGDTAKAKTTSVKLMLDSLS